MFRLFFLMVFSIISANGWAIDLREDKGEHFIIRYDASISRSWAQEVLLKSENYYDTIARRINYPRYNNFWTWDERVAVIIYSDKKTFLKETNQPPWSDRSFHSVVVFNHQL